MSTCHLNKVDLTVLCSIIRKEYWAIQLRKLVLILLLSLISHSNAESDEDLLNRFGALSEATPLIAINEIKTELQKNTHSVETKLKLKLKLSRAYDVSGDFLNSLAIAEEVLIKASEIKNAAIVARAQFSIATENFELGKYSIALDKYKLALKIYKKLNLPAKVGRALMAIGNTLSQYGKFESALEYHMKALKIFHEVKNYKNLALLSNSIGAVHFWLADYKKAIDFYQHAVKYSKEDGRNIGLITYYANLGEAYTQLKEFDHAIKSFNQALLLIGDSGKESYRAVINLYIGKLRFDQGEHAESISYFELVLSFAEASGSDDLYVEALIAKAQAILITDINKALSAGLRALEMSKKLKKQILVRDSHQLLIDIYSSQKDFEIALLHTNLFHQIENQLFEKNKQEKLAKLTSEIDVEEQKHTIALLEKEKVLQASLAKTAKSKQTMLYIIFLVVISCIFILYWRHQNRRNTFNLASQLQAQTKKLKTLHYVGKDLNAHLDNKEIFNRLYKHIGTIVDTHVFAIGLLNEENTKIDFELSIEANKSSPPHVEFLNDESRLSAACINTNSDIVIHNKE